MNATRYFNSRCREHLKHPQLQRRQLQQQQQQQQHQFQKKSKRKKPKQKQDETRMIQDTRSWRKLSGKHADRIAV